MTTPANLTARIYDLDGSVTSQARLISRLGDRLETLDLRELGPRVRCIPSAQSIARLDEACAGERRWLSFTGSGDFHHVTASILKQFDEPVSVVVFDNHSDWVASSPCPCGAWLVDALRLPNVVRIVSIGVGCRSIQGWRLRCGPVDNLFSGRVEFYPYDCRSSRCLGKREGSPACAEVKRRIFATDLYWHTIAGSDWDTLIRRIAGSLPAGKVYLSIDKDCLTTDYAYTNWDAGSLTLDQLIGAIRILSDSREIAGADITGEHSEIKAESRVLDTIAIRFHPRIPPPGPEALRLNEDTNLALVEAMGF